MTEKIKRLYEKYKEMDIAEERKTLANIIGGLFSAKKSSQSFVAAEFTEVLSEYIEYIKASSPREAYDAACVILSYPDTNNYSERELVFAAMHSKVKELLPYIKKDEAERLYAQLDNVPKRYRLPVYKDLKKSIGDMLR